MSSHIKQRKVFEVQPGAYVEVIVQTHMVEDLSAQDIIGKIFERAADLATDHRMLLAARDVAIAADRQAKQDASYDRLFPKETASVASQTGQQDLPDAVTSVEPEAVLDRSKQGGRTPSARTPVAGNRRQDLG